MTSETKTDIVLVTGPSGAGRSTALHALEDIGFETIDNLPISFVSRLIQPPDLDRPLALGLDARNRDFSSAAVEALLGELRDDPRVSPTLIFLDAKTEVLDLRYSETRRRHPLARMGSAQDGIAEELVLLHPLREITDLTLDTSDLSPHELRAELAARFGQAGDDQLSVTVQSFSYKRGVPSGTDIALDCRFLRNPHWQADLRPLTGLDKDVSDHVAGDAGFAEFFERTRGMIEFLLPAYKREGKSHLTISFGCTGGRHRSVAVAEMLVCSLANKGWQVSKRHRELERRA